MLIIGNKGKKNKKRVERKESNEKQKEMGSIPSLCSNGVACGSVCKGTEYRKGNDDNGRGTNADWSGDDIPD